MKIAKPNVRKDETKEEEGRIIGEPEE